MKRYCSDACRIAAFRYAKIGQKPASGTNPLTPISLQPEAIENVDKKEPEKQGVYPPKPARQKLHWERVNEITWKLHAGEKTRTPAVHGHWAGSETYLALAWVIDVGWLGDKPSPRRWLARWHDRSHGPVTLAEAKEVAARLATLTFDIPGDLVKDPFLILNRLSAGFVDASENRAS